MEENMKNFTKAALIVVLIFVVLGSMFCAIGLGIGFDFSEFKEEFEDGRFSVGFLKHIPYIKYKSTDNVWKEKEATTDYAYADEIYQEQEEDEWENSLYEGTSDNEWGDITSDKFEFPSEKIKKLDVEVYYGTVEIFENTSLDKEKIYVNVEYKKENHKRQVEAYLDGKTLKIEEIGGEGNPLNDSTRVTIEISKEIMEEAKLDEIDIEQDAGNIYVDMPLTANKINIDVDAGECNISGKLTAMKKMSMEVDAGSIYLPNIETDELKLSTGMGDIYIDFMLANKIDMECGVGSIYANAGGKESDYDYNINCGIGQIEIGDNNYSGLSTERKIKNSGNKKMDIECGVGTITISFQQ